jgi:tRNA nucleotidyltransferase (CCA-adding enzyme)
MSGREPQKADAAPVPAALAAARFPSPVLQVLRTLDAAGFRSWLVGGAVRDRLLARERTAADHDVATPARPEEVMALFPKVIPTGVEHGTVTVIAGSASIEVTTFRGEGAYLDGRRPSSVTFLEEVDEDLSRRDFTVNALAYDPLRRELRDPFGGRRDLEDRLLRAVGDPAARFAEDGLRPLRAVRFVAQLGFDVEAATRRAIPGALDVVARVAVERVAEELARLLASPAPRRALALLDETGLLGVVLPELASAAPRERAHALDAAGDAAAALDVRLAALLHVLGRGGAAADAGRRARDALARLRFSNAVADAAAALVAQRRCALDGAAAPLPGDDEGVRRWLAHVGRARARAVLALWRADAAAHPAGAAAAQAALAEVAAFEGRVGAVEASRPPLSIAELALDGEAIMRELGIPAGRAVGAALRYALDRALANPEVNTREGLASELRTWWSARAPGG